MTEKLSFGLTNECEALGAFTSFCRIWGSKGTVSLSLETSDGNMLIRFEQRLGPLHGLRPGPLGRQGGQEKHRGPGEGAHKNPRSSRQRRKGEKAAAWGTAENVENPENTLNLRTDQETVAKNVITTNSNVNFVTYQLLLRMVSVYIKVTNTRILRKKIGFQA